MTRKSIKISVIGLGKLGLCTAVCFASKGHNVIGVDVVPDIVGEVNEGRCHIEETGLQEMLTKYQGNIRATLSTEEAVLSTDVTFIIVPTPSKEDGAFSNFYLEKVLKDIGSVLKKKTSFHIVNVTSTIMPGTLETVVKLLLESLSGKVCGIDFGLSYNPEFIALGSVIHDFLNPDIILIGESDHTTGNTLEHIYQDTCDNKPHITRMNWVNAELTKLSINCYVTMKISFANTLAQLCEPYNGADVDVIADAVGHDSRIGTKYIKGGLGFGGPCFPRDNRAFIAAAERNGLEITLPNSVIAVNDQQVARIVRTINMLAPLPVEIAVLGVSYKPCTHITEESQAFMIAQQLHSMGHAIRIYEPQRTNIDFEGITIATSLEDCVASSDLCLIATPWPEFAALKQEMLQDHTVLFDCWRLLDGNNFNHYYALGKNEIAQSSTVSLKPIL